MQTFTRYWLYPTLLIWTVTCMAAAVLHPDHLSQIAALKGAVTVGTLLLFEWQAPLDPRWRMTWPHLVRRDLPMLAVNGAFLAGLNVLLVVLAMETTTADGLLSRQSVVVQVVVGLLVFEALQYSVHRAMHGNSGPVSRFLWRCHAVHHLPQQLYVVMHAVFHPVNALIVRVFVQLTPIWVLGFDPLAVLIYGWIIALQGTVSHLNVDMRLGWLNYLVVGPELHRYHHSARSAEAMNYGAALSVFDLLFGTFRYTPDRQPDRLGLYEQDGYPGQHAPLQALVFPFTRRYSNTGSGGRSNRTRPQGVP